MAVSNDEFQYSLLEINHKMSNQSVEVKKEGVWLLTFYFCLVIQFQINSYQAKIKSTMIRENYVFIGRKLKKLGLLNKLPSSYPSKSLLRFFFPC